jgi:hypothetical protein
MARIFVLLLFLLCSIFGQNWPPREFIVQEINTNFSDEGKSASQTITITVKAASQRYYHLADHLGNVRATACPG